MINCEWRLICSAIEHGTKNRWKHKKSIDNIHKWYKGKLKCIYIHFNKNNLYINYDKCIYIFIIYIYIYIYIYMINACGIELLKPFLSSTSNYSVNDKPCEKKHKRCVKHAILNMVWTQLQNLLLFIDKLQHALVGTNHIGLIVLHFFN